MKDELKNFISNLSEDHFNDLVITYLKEYYDTTHVRYVNGPYDGGIDVEIQINGRELKKNVQVTVQKKNLPKM